MHFSIKRTYWSGHARILELVRPLGITPARADLLRLVALYERTGISQQKIIRHLGVSPPTVTKLLHAMAAKGWIDVIRHKHDNTICVTRAGLVLIAQVISRLILSGMLTLRMAVAWGHGPSARQLWERMYRLLNRARRAFHDRAPFLHPWRRADTEVKGTHPLVWEKRLAADDFDDTVAEDLAVIRKRAKAPIAVPPIPRTKRELENIEANRVYHHDDLVIPGLPDPRARKKQREESEAEAFARDLETLARQASRATPAAPAADAAVVSASATNAATSEKETAEATSDEKVDLTSFWAMLANSSGTEGSTLDDLPKWGSLEVEED